MAKRHGEGRLVGSAVRKVKKRIGERRLTPKMKKDKKKPALNTVTPVAAAKDQIEGLPVHLLPSLQNEEKKAEPLQSSGEAKGEAPAMPSRSLKRRSLKPGAGAEGDTAGEAKDIATSQQTGGESKAAGQGAPPDHKEDQGAAGSEGPGDAANDAVDEARAGSGGRPSDLVAPEGPSSAI